MEQETASLILYTFDINPSQVVGDYANTTENQFGIIANNRCNFTWKNVNMRMIMGEMYDRYETYNIYLYQINQTAGLSASTTSNANQLLVDIRMKGLPFLNNTYNFKTQNNTSSAYLTSYILNSGLVVNIGTVTPMFNPIAITFGKCTERVDINIDIKSTLTQDYPVPLFSSRPWGNYVFMFKIYGIPTRSKNLITNGSRM